MRRSQAVWTLGLLLGVAVGFAPAVRAGEAATSSSGGACMGDPAIPLERAALIDEIQKQAAAQDIPESNGDVVKLNTTGYSYASDQAPPIARDLQVLEIEIRRARAAAQREGRVE
jgi:hypothetical protein